MALASPTAWAPEERAAGGISGRGMQIGIAAWGCHLVSRVARHDPHARVVLWASGIPRARPQLVGALLRDSAPKVGGRRPRRMSLGDDAEILRDAATVVKS